MACCLPAWRPHPAAAGRGELVGLAGGLPAFTRGLQWLRIDPHPSTRPPFVQRRPPTPAGASPGAGLGAPQPPGPRPAPWQARLSVCRVGSNWLGSSWAPGLRMTCISHSGAQKPAPSHRFLGNQLALAAIRSDMHAHTHTMCTRTTSTHTHAPHHPHRRKIKCHGRCHRAPGHPFPTSLRAHPPPGSGPAKAGWKGPPCERGRGAGSSKCC